MDQETLKAHIQKTFDTVCKGYDCHSLRFFKNAAAYLPQIFHFKGNESLLDVATGTGIPALACAPHLPEGKVTAVDFSSGMLQQAQLKASEEGVANIEFRKMDMTDLSLPNDHYDAANCSFGIFFVEDMVGTLEHIASRVKPGGKVVTTHFLEGSFEPLSELFRNKVEQFGVEPPPLGWMRLGSVELNRELYQQAGLKNIEHHSFNVGYRFKKADEWWDVIWNAGYRGLLAGLNESELETFKSQHLEEVSALNSGSGIAFNIEVVITCGRRL